MYETTGSTEAVLPELSIIIPVHNGASTLRACLKSILSAPGPTREVIVVDDGSRDGSAEIAASLGIPTIQHQNNLGPSAARNTGARQTTAPILVFVDADVVIHPGALQRISNFMSENRQYSAVFGSYDAEPGHPGFVSQYRNLLHHFTHQRGNREAETFWAGLGAVRRTAFESVGEFRSDLSTMEDIALGLDLSDAGFRLRLDRELLCTHLKPWTLRTMVTNDVFHRALPWSRVILSRGRFTNDLNTSTINRLGVLFANITFVCAITAMFFPPGVALLGVTCCATFLANTHIFRCFWRERGGVFALAVVPLHFIHQLCSGVGFAMGLTQYLLVGHALGRNGPYTARRTTSLKQSGSPKAVL